MSEDDEILVDLTLDEVCPICLEKGNLFTLSCNHHLHSECAKSMTNNQCPICRVPMDNLPEEVLESINESSRRYQSGLEAEDRSRLNAQNNVMSQLLSIYVRPRPMVELRAAVHHLRNKGIPLSFLPHHLVIKAPAGHPQPEPGVIFSTVVGQVLERIRKVAHLDSDSEDDSDGSDRDSDDPFEDENISLQNIRRSVGYSVVDPQTFQPIPRSPN